MFQNACLALEGITVQSLDTLLSQDSVQKATIVNLEWIQLPQGPTTQALEVMFIF